MTEPVVVRFFAKGWLVLNRDPEWPVGTDIWLRLGHGKVGTFRVVAVDGYRIRTDFNLFFASDGDILEAA